MSKVSQLHEKSKSVHSQVFPSTTYHRADVVGPGVVPVCCDSRTGLHVSGELESTGSAVIVASKLRIGRIGDWVAVGNTHLVNTTKMNVDVNVLS